jgi:exopolyphosphatase/pppGpp-phosphohydrolase
MMCKIEILRCKTDNYAAIDLGSNSFRLEIGVLEHGHIRRVEY